MGKLGRAEECSSVKNRLAQLQEKVGEQKTQQKISARADIENKCST